MKHNVHVTVFVTGLVELDVTPTDEGFHIEMDLKDARTTHSCVTIPMQLSGPRLSVEQSDMFQHLAAGEVLRAAAEKYEQESKQQEVSEAPVLSEGAKA